jgi:hypothetical protein
MGVSAYRRMRATPFQLRRSVIFIARGQKKMPSSVRSDIEDVPQLDVAPSGAFRFVSRGL